MATQRYISTSFWDDAWIRSLRPIEKFIYMYLMTNTLTNIAGVYEITIDRICFDTGCDNKTIESALNNFKMSKKAYMFSNYIVLPTWPKHQKWETKGKIKDGIISILKKLPPDLLGFLKKIGYTYPIDTLPVPYTYEPNYSEFDSDSDSDIDIDIDINSSSPASADVVDDSPTLSVKKKPMSAMKDPLADHYQNKFIERTPAEAWKSIPQERAQLIKLAKNTRQMISVTGFEDELELAESILSMYERMKRTSRERFIRDGPWTPSGLVARWDQVIESMRQTVSVDNWEEMPF